jgi:hypothetical protein
MAFQILVTLFYTFLLEAAAFSAINVYVNSSLSTFERKRDFCLSNHMRLPLYEEICILGPTGGYALSQAVGGILNEQWIAYEGMGTETSQTNLWLQIGIGTTGLLPCLKSNQLKHQSEYISDSILYTICTGETQNNTVLGKFFFFITDLSYIF